MINAGKLDQRVTLQTKQVTRNSIGEEISSWVNFATVWANYRPVSVQERFVGAQLQAEFDAVFRIRRLPDLRCVLLDTEGLPLQGDAGDYLLASDCVVADEIQNGVDAESRVIWKGRPYELTGAPMIADPRTGEMDLFCTSGIRDGRSN